MFEDSEERSLSTDLSETRQEGRRMTPQYLMIVTLGPPLIWISFSYKMKMTPYKPTGLTKAQIENLALRSLERMKHLKSVAFVSQSTPQATHYASYLAPMNIMITALITGCLSTQPVLFVVGQ